MDGFVPEGYLINTEENRAAVRNISALREARDKGTVLEATALLCDAEHNITVDLGGIRGIIPREQGAVGIAEGTVRDIALISRVGKPVCFTVSEIKEDSRTGAYALLSRAEAQKRCAREFISGLVPGDVIPARITHFEPFGAFCDIGCGLAALLPIDSISVSRISHPRDRFSCGDDIRAIVKSIENGRVTLSLKELLGTWEENAAEFGQGQTVSGIVRSIEDYGIFVELAPNLAGLAELRDGVFVGQQAGVYIKSMLPEKMKVKLVIIDSFDRRFAPPSPLHYYFEGKHINRWEYSPENCTKKVFSDFTVENLGQNGYN